METAHLYSFVVPVPEEFRDNKSTQPLIVIPVQLKDGRIWESAVLGTPSTVQAIRISIPDVQDKKIDDGDFKRFMRLRIYMLDCIRLVYDPNAEYFRNGDHILSAWNFLDPEIGPNLAIKISEPPNPDYRVNSEGLKILIAAPKDIRPLVHLISDGNNPRLPLQFRFLSYYKILELHYRVTANKRFNEFIAPFISDFQIVYPDINSVRKLCGQLSKLRNKCAHIKLTTGDLGFSHAEAEPDDLFKVMPIIRRIAVRCIAVNHPQSPLRFSATPEENAAQFAEMEAAGLKPVHIPLL